MKAKKLSKNSTHTSNNRSNDNVPNIFRKDKNNFFGGSTAKKEESFFKPAMQTKLSTNEASNKNETEKDTISNQAVQKLNTNTTEKDNKKESFWGNLWDGATDLLEKVTNWETNVFDSVGNWLWDLVTLLPTRVWRILKHIGSGIVDTVLWFWNSIIRALSNVWHAAAGAFGWLKDGVSGFFKWIWTGVQGGATWAKKILQGDFSGFWQGIKQSFTWLGSGASELLKWGWEGLKAVIIWAKGGIKGIAKRIGDGLFNSAAWALRLVAKLLDLVGFGEVLEILFAIVKIHTRKLTAVEKQEAEKVFGNSIDYDQVRIDEHSIIAKIGSYFQGGSGLGVTLFHTINFNKPVSATPGDRNMEWLIHELTHVAQYEHVGMQYIGEAIYAQATEGYEYGDGEALEDRNLRDFNREQQADIISHAYLGIFSNKFLKNKENYQRMLNQVRQGKL